MAGYRAINRNWSGCVHFVRNSQIEEGFSEWTQELKDQGIICAYVDYEVIRGQHIADCLADTLRLQHAPYRSRKWIQLADDLVTLSNEVNGVVMVIDNADLFFASARDDAFELIEYFLLQFQYWFEK